jgi:hypothetical protein
MENIATLKTIEMGNLGVKNASHLGKSRQTSLFSLLNAVIEQIGICSITKK